MCVGILDKNEEKMAVILFWKLEKNSIVRDMSKATADRKESHKTNSYSVQ